MSSFTSTKCQLKDGIHFINGKTNVEAYAKLEQGIYAALETYSNVHRGSGLKSLVTTHLYEQARSIILDYLGLDKRKYVVIFCTPARATVLKAQFAPKSYHSLSSRGVGLPLGVRVLAVKKKALPKGAPFQTGGGTARLISRKWVIWAQTPDKFEAGTPSIVNIIAYAIALRQVQKYGKDIFLDSIVENLTISEILYHDELENCSGPELLHELRKTRIGKGVCAPTLAGVKPFINLDNSASTPTFEPVWNTFRMMLLQPLHVQQEVVKEVKSICAEVLGAPLSNYDVIFTSNTTEAINLAAQSLGGEPEDETEPVIVNTLLEHSSNDLPWRMVPGHSLIRLQVDPNGFIDLHELEALLRSYNSDNHFGKKRIKLVAVSGASNVLGVCNNIGEISQIVHRYNARLLVDAAQLIAHRKVDMEGCGIDYLAFSGHKVYAPFGCGALVVRKGLLNFSTGEMDQIRASGEENASGIAALGKALLLLKRIDIDFIHSEEEALTKRALRGLAQIPGLTIFGISNPELPIFDQKIGVIVFNLNSMMANRVASEITLQSGIGLRFGCHCAHIIIKHLLNIPPFLERFQGLIVTLFPKMSLPGLTRISLGIENTESDVDTFVNVLGQIAKKVKPKADSFTTTSQNGTATFSKAEVKKQINDFLRAVAMRVYS